MELFYAGRHICPMGYQNPRNNRSCYNEVSLHMLALNLDSRPCQVFLQLLASDLSFQQDKNYLSKCKALPMKYTARAVGKPAVYFHRLQLVCMAEMIHSSGQQNKSAYRGSETEHILPLLRAPGSVHDLTSFARRSSRLEEDALFCAAPCSEAIYCYSSREAECLLNPASSIYTFRTKLQRLI